MRNRWGLALPLALLVAVALGGCSASPAVQVELGYEIGVGHVPGLGRVLVDSAGRTLYLYVPDRQGTSRCAGRCARQWPPLMASSRARFGSGVDRALIGSVRRAGGARQMTYNGWPLYTWYLDVAPGQATGQNDDMGLWEVISPSGNAVH